MPRIIPTSASVSVTEDVTTVQVTSPVYSAGASLGVTTKTYKVRLRNLTPGKTAIQYKVGAGSWNDLLPASDGNGFISVDLSTATVLVRHSSYQAASLTLEVTTYTAGDLVEDNGTALGVSTTGGGSAGTVPAFKGHTGIRACMPFAALSGSAGYSARTLDTEVSAVDLNGVFGGWAFWRLNAGNEQTYTGSAQFMVYLEYPKGSGNFYPSDENVAAGSIASPQPVSFNFGTATEKTLYLNWAKLKISKGVPVGIWAMQMSSDFVFYRQGGAPDQAFPSGQSLVTSSTNTFANILDSYGTNFSEYSFPPVIFGGMTTQRNAMAIPDSREAASPDGPRPPFYVTGMIGPGIAQNFGFLHAGMAGMSLVQFLAGNAYAQRQLLARWFTDVGHFLGVNDISGQSQSAAQFIANSTTFAGLFPGKRMFMATIAPNPNTTTDGYNSIASQVSNNAQTILETNALVRQVPTGFSYIYDIAREIDPYDTGLVPVSLNKTLAARASTCVMTASIAGSTLTMSALTSGTLKAGDPITDNLTGAGSGPICCTIIRQLTGTAGGGAGATFKVSRPQTLSSRTLYAAGFAMADGYHYTTAINEQAKPAMAATALANMGQKTTAPS